MPAGGIGFVDGEKDDNQDEPDEGDARTLFVDYDEQGLRHKPWRKVCLEAKEYASEDWGHEGPATVLYI